jgi:hypothetical protein
MHVTQGIRRSRRPYLAAALLGAASIVEIVHSATGATYPSLTAGASIGISVFMIVVMALGAIGLATKTPWGWHLGVYGALASVVHGSNVCIYQNDLGPFFFAAGVAAGILIFTSMPMRDPVTGESRWSLA